MTLGELIRGYQRNADYTRKTMRLGEERREAQQARRQADAELAAAQSERQHYGRQLDGLVPQLREQLQAQFAGIDWARLAAEEPARFAELAPAFETMTQQLQQAEAAQLALRQQDRQQRLRAQAAHRQHLAEQKRALIERHPELGDPEAWRREAAALTSYLLGAGYDQHELDRLVDHRDVTLVRKAMLYDRMAASKGRIADRLAPLPKLQRPGAARDRRDGGKERRQAMLKRLQSTGSAEDAARLIADII